MNGSDPHGRCSDHRTRTFNDGATRITCLVPSTSVLFDARIPILSHLGGSSWAYSLLVLGASHIASINFDLRGRRYTTINRVEVVMFNCPWWGLGAESIALYSPVRIEVIGGTIFNTIHPTITSCTSLVRVCIPCTVCNNKTGIFGLEFRTGSTDWVHIAEVTFHEGTRINPCPEDIVITQFTPVVSICNFTIVQGIMIAWNL